MGDQNDGVIGTAQFVDPAGDLHSHTPAEAEAHARAKSRKPGNLAGITRAETAKAGQDDNKEEPVIELTNQVIFDVLRRAAFVNRRFERYANTPLRHLDRLCDVVQPGVERTDASGRTADEQRIANVRVAESDSPAPEHEVRATATRRELDQRSHGYSDICGPRPATGVPFASDY